MNEYSSKSFGLGQSNGGSFRGVSFLEKDAVGIGCFLVWGIFKDFMQGACFKNEIVK